MRCQGVTGCLDNTQTGQGTGQENIGVINQHAAGRAPRNNHAILDKLPFHHVPAVIAEEVNRPMLLQICQCCWPPVPLQIGRSGTGDHSDFPNTSGDEA